MIDVYLTGEAEPRDKIPGDCTVLSILLGDQHIVGKDSYYVPAETEFDIPVPNASVWGKWSASNDVLRRNDVPNLHWSPMEIGLGQGMGGNPVGPYIGPELSLAHERVAQLREHCEVPARLMYGMVKFGSFGATLGPLPNPRGSFAPTKGDDYGLLDEFLERYLMPAIESIRSSGRRVLIDAVYLSLGTNDLRKDQATREKLIKGFKGNLDALLGELFAALGLARVPVVAALPYKAEPLFEAENVKKIGAAITSRQKRGEPFWTVDLEPIVVGQGPRKADLDADGQMAFGRALAATWDDVETALQEVGRDVAAQPTEDQSEPEVSEVA